MPPANRDEFVMGCSRHAPCSWDQEMSLLLKAFPPGRPHLRTHASARALVTIVVTFVALVAAIVAAREPCSRGAEAARAAGAPPRATPAPGEAQAEAPQAQAPQAQTPQAQAPETQAPETQAPETQAEAEAEDPGPAAEGVRRPGHQLLQLPQPQPRREARDPQPGAEVDQQHLGWSSYPPRRPKPGNGTIRIATWSFDDWDIAHALVAARKRGVSVQIVAAKGRNNDHPAWTWLRSAWVRSWRTAGTPRRARP